MPAAITIDDRLALDGGSPHLASGYVATWASPAGDDEQDVLAALSGSTRPGNRQRQVDKLERRWRAATGRNHVVACRSATASVKLALRCLGVGPGDEVICPADAVVSPLALGVTGGAVVVPVDVAPDTLQLDPGAVADAVTARTRAILAVDRYGTTPDLRALAAIAADHGVALIEDGSQARGALYDGRPVGSFGTISICGLGGGVRSVLGQGAVFATDDARVAATARHLLLLDAGPDGVRPVLDLTTGGWLQTMSELDAAVANAQVLVADADVPARAANGEHLARRLAAVPGLDVPGVVRGATHVYTSLPVLVRPDELGLPETLTGALRDTVIDCLMAEGLAVDRWTPQPVGAGGDLPDPTAPISAATAPPVVAAVAEAALLLGADASAIGGCRTTADMDRIAACFHKVLVANQVRVRELVLERTTADT